MTAPRDFEPVRVHFVVSAKGTIIGASDYRNATELAHHIEGSTVVEGVALPLSPPPDALERMAKAMHLRDLQAYFVTVDTAQADKSWEHHTNALRDEYTARARAAFAALVAGAK